MENTCRVPRSRTFGWSSGVAAGSSRSSRSLTIAWQTSIRKPATPRSYQKRSTSSNASRTSGFHQLRSGWEGRKLLRKYWPEASSSVHAEPPKFDSQLFGGPPPAAASAHT